MIDYQISQDRLNHFNKKLDLSSQSDRRIGVRIMVDFYGTIMARVGMEALGFDRTIKGPNIVEQWEAVSGKLRSLDGLDIPGEFHKVIRELHRDLRNEAAHNFIYDPPKNVLEESRSIAEKWRSWFLDSSEEYSKFFGAYSTVEYEEMRFHMKGPLHAYDYVYVATQLEMEVEHAVRNLIKSKGIMPMKYGLRHSVRTATREGILEEEHLQQYNDLTKLVSEARGGAIEYTFSDNIEEVAWNTSEDTEHQELGDAQDTVHRNLELLEYVHDLQSPFNTSR